MKIVDSNRSEIVRKLKKIGAKMHSNWKKGEFATRVELTGPILFCFPPSKAADWKEAKREASYMEQK